jgi:DNA polymerase III subunit beta
MRVVINQELLAQTLSTVSKAVAARSLNPVLNHVRLVADADSLTLTATDGEFTIRQRLAVGGADAGRVLAPAKLLSDLVGRLGKQDVTLEVAGNQLNVAAGRAKYDLTVLGDENFPELPDFTAHRLIALPCGLLKRALGQTAFSAVKESSTGAVHYTNGVFFRFKGGRLDIVATDGHRLALKRNEGLGADGMEQDLLLPARVASELERLLPDDEDAAVEIYHHEHQVFFKFSQLLVASALLDVKFPDYERVIPKDVDSKVHVRRDEFGAALERVLLVCRMKDRNPVGHLETQGETMRMKSDAGEIGKGVEELAVEVSGSDIRIALNPQYVIEVLKVLGGEQVTINWINEVQPAMVTSPRDPDFLYIVMPIRME